MSESTRERHTNARFQHYKFQKKKEYQNWMQNKNSVYFQNIEIGIWTLFSPFFKIKYA
jgi:hypothetical protein